MISCAFDILLTYALDTSLIGTGSDSPRPIPSASSISCPLRISVTDSVQHERAGTLVKTGGDWEGTTRDKKGNMILFVRTAYPIASTILATDMSPGYRMRQRKVAPKARQTADNRRVAE